MLWDAIKTVKFAEHILLLLISFPGIRMIFMLPLITPCFDMHVGIYFKASDFFTLLKAKQQLGDRSAKPGLKAEVFHAELLY